MFRNYYKFKRNRVSICTANTHAITHLPACVQEFGPFWVFWCFVVERYCGSLPPLVHSRRTPYLNLANAVLEIERIRMVLLLPNIQAMINDLELSSLLIPRTNNVNKPRPVYSNELYEEDFYLPRSEIQLDSHCYRLLREFYQRYELENNGRTKVSTAY
jgi:hypothetical protein